LLSYVAAKDSGTGVVTFVASGSAVFPNSQTSFNGVRHVKFDATSGGSFSFGNTDFSGVVLDATFDGGGSRHIHFARVESATSSPSPKPSFTILNSDIGPNNGVGEDLIHLRNVTDTLFQGNTIHDLTKSSSSDHADCIQNMGSSVNLSFIGNTFQRCWSEAIIEKADFGADTNIKFNNNRILDPINGDGTTPYAIGYFGGGYSVSKVTGEIRGNCILATSHNQVVVDHVTVNGGSQTVTEGGDNVVVSGNLYGGC
jgi:hypothetical protein